MTVLNSKADLWVFFGTTLGEFEEFWDSLTNDEKYYYRTTDLKTGLYKGLGIRRTDYAKIDD